MTISERIFEKIDELSITQKEFSQKTGILQSTISEWKKKKTNPSSDKIMIICQVLDVTPEWLLSGVDETRKKGSEFEYIVISRNSDAGDVLNQYNSLNSKTKERLKGYLDALVQMQMSREKK